MDEAYAGERAIENVRRVATGVEDSPVESGPSTVIRTILNTLPEPSADTPWQEILNFGQDSAARAEIALLEAEQRAPGREVAYIAHARERFY
ncbi:hypothetical protein FAZ95_17930 [Trinickia violacea]|uniref:Uncharacterized protein n=1 Tax=Trinickia violacea TaxID=2571746 RepID=A0A4P8ISX7_9BURK|nr:hypothetical protein [Trinickia violacea]QCP50865.1 hypothetical protein FAZ95_17930 [Trinickia violacea]